MAPAFHNNDSTRLVLPAAVCPTRAIVRMPAISAFVVDMALVSWRFLDRGR
jgi:hypothetical protein